MRRCAAQNPVDGSAVSPFTLFGQTYGESDDVLIDRLMPRVPYPEFRRLR